MGTNKLEQGEKITDRGCELEKLEICVSCGKQTDIPRDMDISERSFYIEGAGQLCRDCYYQLYGPGRARE